MAGIHVRETTNQYPSHQKESIASSQEFLPGCPVYFRYSIEVPESTPQPTSQRALVCYTHDALMGSLPFSVPRMICLCSKKRPSQTHFTKNIQLSEKKKKKDRDVQIGNEAKRNSCRAMTRSQLKTNNPQQDKSFSLHTA